MTFERKSRVAAAGSMLGSFLTVMLFISLCWTAAADAQGAIAFALYLPVLVALIAASIYLGNFSAQTTAMGRIAKRVAQVLAIFCFLFYLSPFVGLRALSDGVIGAVSRSFEAITGRTPMAWDKIF